MILVSTIATGAGSGSGMSGCCGACGPIPASSSSSSPLSPKLTINTTYPVWRARNLPFGKGILSLAQRGETTLEMYAIGDGDSESDNVAVKTFEGHTDVVKEFVWRNKSGLRGAHGNFTPVFQFKRGAD